MVSRRKFLSQLSATSAYALQAHRPAGLLTALAGELPANPSAASSLEGWEHFGRLEIASSFDSVILTNGYIVSPDRYTDAELSFRARAPENASEVQIWAGLRWTSRDTRYMFGLRGGNNDDLYIFRHDADGGAQFLDIAPLEFHPVAGTWYRLRIVTADRRILLYLNDETLPRINIVDEQAKWKSGSFSLGGGWLPSEFRDVSIRTLSPIDLANLQALGAKTWNSPRVDKEKLRVAQRSAYKPFLVESLVEPRTVLSLNGNWLFSPDYDRRAPEPPQNEHSDDSSWHVMDVPNFWTPTLSWLHGEVGFKQMHGIAASKGISDKLFLEEQKRLDAYTFDWQRTQSGWYRHHIDLPETIAHCHAELSFDAIAKVAEVWVNGIQVGSHVGMFGDFHCDISKAVRPGRNLLAVHVLGDRKHKKASDSEVLGVAVTVEVTSEMLTSLPHGMYPQDAGGIWQPVYLIVTAPCALEDICVTPRLDSMTFRATVRNSSATSKSLKVSYIIRSNEDQSILHASDHPLEVDFHSGETAFELATPVLRPKLWWPNQPSLYTLEVTLWDGKALHDRLLTTFGFRTFSTQDSQLLLNGRPYWLRGANHFPHALRPNDSHLAERFMELAKSGNVTATRSHTAPFTRVWLEAADRAGMLVSFEGTWPWLMLEGDIPDEDLLRVWRAEFESLIRKYRNHPSIVIWTINNEMKFEVFDKKHPSLLHRKWEVLSSMVRRVRELDPSRPVICDSSYCRHDIGADYANVVEANRFDDGDIDDAHRYYGWYEPTFFHFNKGEFANSVAYPNRPLISQEMSSGYPRNDDGHPTRFYLFKHHTPQSFVGLEAYDNRDPALFLGRQTFLTKELAETLRRTNRSNCSGILHFAYVSWFRNVWSAGTIQPLPTYEGLKAALQPVLVSAELYGRHLLAGAKAKVNVCIANDAEDGTSTLPGHIAWAIHVGSTQIVSGELQSPGVSYYANTWVELPLEIPEALPAGRVDARLSLALHSGGKVVSTNAYDLVLAEHAWTDSAGEIPFALFAGTSDGRVREYFEHARTIRTFADVRPEEIVVMETAEATLADSKLGASLLKYISTGGRALLLQPGSSLPSLLPESISQFRSTNGEITTMHIPESKVFDGLQPLDLAWFNLGDSKLPRSCRGVYKINRNNVNVTTLADVTDIHGYLQTPEDLAKYSGTPLVEITIGKGRLICSEMFLLEGERDPIARRLLSNILHSLSV